MALWNSCLFIVLFSPPWTWTSLWLVQAFKNVSFVLESLILNGFEAYDEKRLRLESGSDHWISVFIYPVQSHYAYYFSCWREVKVRHDISKKKHILFIRATRPSPLSSRTRSYFIEARSRPINDRIWGKYRRSHSKWVTSNRITEW